MNVSEKNIDRKKLSPLFVVSAGCLWGAMGIFVRSYNKCGVGSMSIVFLRALFTSLIILVWLLAADRSKLRIRLRDTWIFVGMGLLSIVFFNFCYFTAISLTSLSVAAILLYTSPIFVMLMSAIFFREKITLGKALSLIAAIAGLTLVTGVWDGGNTVTLKGAAYGIGSAFGYALYSIFGRAAVDRKYDARTSTFWSFAFAAFFSLFMADMPAIKNMICEKPSMLAYSALFAALVSALPYILYSLGLEGMETGRAGVLASVEPVSATLIGALLYGEYPSASAVAGIVIVLSALALPAILPEIRRHKSTDRQ